jgi:hypothetical protein
MDTASRERMASALKTRLTHLPGEWIAVPVIGLVVAAAAWGGLLAEVILFGFLLLLLLVVFFYRNPAALVGLLFLTAPLITYRGPYEINPFRVLLGVALIVFALMLARRPELFRIDACLVFGLAFVLKQAQSFAASDHMEFAGKDLGLHFVGIATFIAVSSIIRFGRVRPKQVARYLLAGIALVTAMNLYEIIQRSVFREYWVTLPFATVTVTEHHQIMPGIYRTHLPLSTPNHYGSYAAVGLLVLAGILRAGRGEGARRTGRLGSLLTMPLLAVTFLCTFSRTAIISLFTGTVFLFSGKRGGRGFWAAGLALFLLAATFVVALTTTSLVLGFDPDVFLTRMTTRGRFGRGLMEHLEWKEKAVRLWMEHPVLGAGLHDYGPYAGQRVGTSRAHSVYFTILAESGLVGLFLFLAFLLILYRTAAEAISAEKNPADRILLSHLAAGFVGFLAASVFYDFFIEQEWWWVYLGMLYGFAVREGARSRPPSEDSIPSSPGEAAGAGSSAALPPGLSS